MDIPNSGQNFIPMLSTVLNRLASSPSSPQAHIQLPESLIFSIEPIYAEDIFVIASAMARRPDAGASITATGVLSPIAIALPVCALKECIVNPTSETGTW